MTHRSPVNRCIAAVVAVLAVAALASGCASGTAADDATDVAARDQADASPRTIPTPLDTDRALPKTLPPSMPAGASSGSAPLVPADGITTQAPSVAGVTEHTDPSPDPQVVGAQRRLAALRYYAGPADGVEGPATRTAVEAFQKVQGLPVDGALGDQTLQALATPTLPALHAGLADRIEIDLDTQVMYVVLDGQLARILPVSSGNGEPYSYAGGGRARGLTPVGSFTVDRKVSGTIDAYFGRLYDAMYFHEGWAIHGSGNVPATPASHGCVRVPRADATWLFDVVPEGMAVLIRGELNSFDPAAGESAGTSDPEGSLPAADPVPPPSAGFS